MDNTIQRRHCVNCKETFEDGDTVMGVAVGVAQHGEVTAENIQWRHMECWTPLPERE
jgi:hypothetical protein